MWITPDAFFLLLCLRFIKPISTLTFLMVTISSGQFFDLKNRTISIFLSTATRRCSKVPHNHQHFFCMLLRLKEEDALACDHKLFLLLDCILRPKNVFFLEQQQMNGTKASISSPTTLWFAWVHDSMTEFAGAKLAGASSRQIGSAH